MKKLVLIDGSNLIFRAYYATEKFDMTSPDGTPINAVKTLLGMIDKIIKTEKPDHLFVAMDAGTETFRHKFADDYKGTRPSAPENLKVQFPLVYDMLDAMGIKHSASDEFEADDLIYTYADMAKDKGYKVKAITGDKDLLQIIEENVNVLTPKMGFAKECDYDVATFEEKYTFEPKRMIEYKALVGDTSDNIIGVPKLGDKTAKKLLNEYPNLEAIIKAAKDGEIKGKLGENIVASEQKIIDNVHMVTLVNNAEIKYDLDELEFQGYDFQSYGEFLRKHGFIKEYNQLIDQGVFNETENQDEDFTTFDSIEFEEIEQFKEEYTDEITSIYTQSLKANYIMSQNLGYGIVSKKGNFYLKSENVNEEFKEYIKSDKKKIIFNVKRLLVSLQISKVNGLIIDPYLGFSLLDSKNFSKDMASLFSDYNIHYIKPTEYIYGTKSNPKIKDEDLMKKDIVSKAMASLECYEQLQAKITDEGLENVLYNIEIPLSSVLSKMERVGILIDKNTLAQSEKHFEDEIKEMDIEIAKFTDININSSAQLAELLFEEWNLPKQGLKKTTKSISTDVDNMEKLLVMLKDKEDDYEKEISFLNLVLEYRKKAKILTTYLKQLQKFITKDAKIHPINNQLQAETGRLSVMDPSIQNMPIKGEYSDYIRSLFVAGENANLIAFDYSQVELRIMAVFSNDEAMLDAFRNNRDIHEETAKKIFDTDNVTPEERNSAKAINFGIIYGMSPYGLAKTLGISNAEAGVFIDRYFEEFPGVRKFMDETMEQAEKQGYVTTISGRRRNLPTINSKNFREKEHAKRMAINTPIQGSGADIIKIALIEVNKKLEENLLKTRMIMQIHDEIVFEVPKEEEQEVIPIIKDVMENVMEFPIKLKVDYGIGKTWLDTK